MPFAIGDDCPCHITYLNEARALSFIQYRTRKIPLVKSLEVYMNISINGNEHQGKSSFLTLATVSLLLLIGSVAAAMLPAASSKTAAPPNCDLPMIDSYNENGAIPQVADCAKPVETAQPKNPDGDNASQSISAVQGHRLGNEAD
jgi:hypothetical protein